MASLSNTQNLISELNWLVRILECFKHNYILKHNNYIQQTAQDIETVIANPPVPEDSGFYSSFISDYMITAAERALIIFALAPSLKPGLLRNYFRFSQRGIETDMPEFGGITGRNFTGFIPTGLSWLYLMAEEDTKKRLEVIEMTNDSILVRENIVGFGNYFPGEPFMSGPIYVNDYFMHQLLTNQPYQLFNKQLLKDGRR